MRSSIKNAGNKIKFENQKIFVYMARHISYCMKLIAIFYYIFQTTLNHKYDHSNIKYIWYNDMHLIVRKMCEMLFWFTRSAMCKYSIAISCHLYDNTLSKPKYDIRVIMLLLLYREDDVLSEYNFLFVFIYTNISI